MNDTRWTAISLHFQSHLQAATQPPHASNPIRDGSYGEGFQFTVASFIARSGTDILLALA